MKVKKVYNSLKRIIFPERCVFCGKVVPYNSESCTYCTDNLQEIKQEACRFCGAEKSKCSCEKNRNFYNGISAPFYYAGPASECVKRLKFKRRTSCASFLGKRMADNVKKHCGKISFDVVSCVPMTKKEFRARGYNQSALLAKTVARELDLPFDGSVIEKVYETKAQRTLGALSRSGNVFGAYRANNVENKKVLLCDDVRTTGSTLNECAKMLILCGAEYVWCVTATVNEGNKSKES